MRPEEAISCKEARAAQSSKWCVRTVASVHKAVEKTSSSYYRTLG